MENDVNEWINKHPQPCVVAGLTVLIRTTLAAHERERSLPSRSPDEMDHFIGQTGERVKLLRRLREEFENEMARSMDYDPR